MYSNVPVTDINMVDTSDSFTTVDTLNTSVVDYNCTLIKRANGSFTCEDPAITRMKATITLITTCVNIVLAIGIIIANSFVLAAFVKFKFVRTVHNALLLNMSMADLFTAPPIILANVLTNFYMYNEAIETPCVMTAWLFALCFEGQIWMLLLVTINRWVSIRYPLTHHMIFSKRKTALITGSVWAALFSMTTGCVAHHQWGPGTKCYPFRVVKPICYKILVYPLILLPLILMPVLYVVLTRYAHAHSKKMKQHRQGTSDAALNSRSQEIKTLKTLGMILGILYISWMPTFILSFVMTIEPTDYTMAVVQKLFRDIATSCLYLGSLFNPIVYHRSSPTFRKAFLIIMNKIKDDARKGSSDNYFNLSSGSRKMSQPAANNSSGSGGADRVIGPNNSSSTCSASSKSTELVSDTSRSTDL